MALFLRFLLYFCCCISGSSFCGRQVEPRRQGNEKEIDFVIQDVSKGGKGKGKCPPFKGYLPGAGTAATPAETARLLRLRPLQRGRIGLLQYIGCGATDRGGYTAYAPATAHTAAHSAAAVAVAIAVTVAVTVITIIASVVGRILLGGCSHAA